MKKKMLSMLLCLCMVCGLLPATAMAATSNPPKIKVGSVILTDDQCITHNGADATAVSGDNSGDYVAYYKDGVLHLNGLNVNNGVILWSDSSLGGYGNYHLTIQLEDGSVNTVTRTTGSAILGNTGLGSTGPHLTIQGDGTLYAVGATNGIWVWNNTTITGSAKVIAQGVTLDVSQYAGKYGIATNNGSGVVAIEGNADVTAIGEVRGISGDNSASVSAINVTAPGKLMARGGKALQKAPTTSLQVNNNGDETICGVGQPATPAEETPAAAYVGTSDTTGVLKNVEAGMKYKLGYSDWVDITSDADIVLSDVFEGCTISVVRKGDGSATVDSNVQVLLVEEYVPTTYTVRFDANGGSFADQGGAEEYSYQASYDEQISAPTAPVKGGHTFAGWEKDGESVSFPYTMPAEDVEFLASWTAADMVFNYAYDAQRSPSYPGKGDTIRLSSLTKPLVDLNTSGDTNEGEWKLAPVGAYAQLKDTDNYNYYAHTTQLESVITSIAGAYGFSNKDEVVVHELTDGTSHIAYGVVVAYSAEDSMAVFLGDTWNGGAGYLLSDTAKSGTVYMEADTVATDFVPQDPVEYTVSFDANGHGTAPTAQTIAFGGKVTKPADPAADGYTFDGWYREAACTNAWNFDTDTVSGSTTLYAKWTEVFEIEGTVTDTTGGNVTVRLMQHGAQIGADKTVTLSGTDPNWSGTYTFNDVRPGVYNLVVTKGDVTMTVLVVVDGSETVDFHLPDGKKNSVVDNANAGAYAAVVGGLEQIATTKPDGTSYAAADVVEVTLTVKEEADNAADSEQNAIQAAAGNKELNFLDLTLTLTVNGVAQGNIGNDNTQLLTIVIPYDTSKDGITVYRFHGSNAEALSENPADGSEGFEVLDSGFVIIYAKQFSTYAIGYDVAGSGTVTPQPPVYYPTAHSCVSKCAVCGGCTDANCKQDACTDKCVLLTMRFTDVAKALWCYDEVAYVYHRGLMGGYGSDFRPGGSVTRQQVWMVLARMSGEAPVNMAAARSWAMANDISDGSNPTAAVTRQQFITMLWRYAKDNGYDVSVGEDTNILSYTDAFDIADYAIAAMQWGCGEGIIGGYNDGSLKPMNGTTRGHMAAFLQRFCEAVK
ncbi:MAG: InlB B-repeat-containing protein [Oscillospiraceae bacterium]|nr:InlB B-repeat-containing protein [Oscillospiraceae bacterium]